jgi:hypothetical protein
MSIDARKVRKLLAAAILATLAGTPVAAERSMDCEYHEQWYGLFCNNGEDILICIEPDGCTADCGQGAIPVSC